LPGREPSCTHLAAAKLLREPGLRDQPPKVDQELALALDVAVVDLSSGVEQSVEIEGGATTLEWASDGQVLAVGGANVLKLFD
jgi:hypothetical protein